MVPEYAGNPERGGSLSVFLRKVLKELGLSDSLQAAGDERIRQAYVYIDEHIGSDMTVASIAGHFCMSESRFSHLFRKEAGMSVANYLVFRKLYFTYLGLMKGKILPPQRWMPVFRPFPFCSH